MKNSLLLLFITIICLSGGSAFAGVSPQVAQTYWVANGNTISGSASAPVQFSVSTSQSITVQVNGTNNGTSMAPFGGVDVEIREVTGSNGTQINLTSITSPGANSGPNTWWAGTALPTGQTAQCLHMESVWNNWIGGGGQNPVIFTFTPLQPGTYHVYAKMYLSDGSGNLPRDPSGSTPNTDDQGQGTYLIGTITVLCTVNLTAYPSGAGTTSGGGAYPQGMSVTVTATPNSGYGFLFWLQNGTQMSGNLSYKFTIEANISLEAVFGPLETISFATNPNLSGLGVTVDGSTALTPFSVTWTAGTVHTIGFPSPEYLGTGTRYNWSSWSDGGTESHSVTAPGNPITYTAYVTPQYQLTVSSAYGSTSGSGWYNSGATAYAGLNGGTFSGGTGIQYVFSSWGTDASGSSYSQSNGIVMNGPKTATTNWTTQYYLTMSTPTNGTVTPASSGYYNSGQSVQISATPNTGYNFGGWTGTGSGSYSGSNNPANITMNGPITESATFTQSTSITVTTNPPGLAITVDGNSYTSPKTFTNWTPGSPHTISTTSTQSGGTGTQYIWSNWSDGGAISHSVTAPSSSYTYSATFTTEYYLTVNSAYGSTSGSGWYNSGTTVYAGLNGETFSGGTGIQYVFSSWGTDASGSSYSQSNGILMNGPRSATANWTTQYYLTMSPPTNGTVTPTSSGYYNSGQSVQISANPNGGYEFDGWTGTGSGSYTGSNNPASITMNGPITESVNFLTAIGKLQGNNPESYYLTQNYPNPFNPVSVISYGLPNRSFVLLAVYDMLGTNVRILVEGEKAAGSYQVILDASNFPSGVYFYRLIAGSFTQTRKLILLK